MASYALICINFNVLNTGCNVLTIRLFSSNQQQLGFWLNLLSALFGLGGVVAPQLVTFTSAVAGSGTGAYYVTSGLTVAIAVAACALPNGDGAGGCCGQRSKGCRKRSRGSGPEPAGPEDDSDEDAMDLASPELAPEDATLRDAKAGPPKGFMQAWVVLLPAMALIFANVSIELGYGAWVYAYATLSVGLPHTVGEAMASLYWVAFTAGRLAGVSQTPCRSSDCVLLNILLHIATISAALSNTFQCYDQACTSWWWLLYTAMGTPARYRTS